MEEDYGYSFGQQQDDDGYDLFGFEDEGLEPEDAGVTETMNERDAVLISRRSELQRKLSDDSETETYHVREIIQAIEDVLTLPEKTPKDDLAAVRSELDASNYGMNAAKDAVLRFLAMRKTAPEYSGKSLCLVGPSGVGKTSIAQAIARIMDCGFYKFSVGGLSDAFTLKGSAKDYKGAQCGQIVKGLIASGSRNPVFVIDEVDKVSHTGQYGDPAAVLLEVLDRNQNREFVDAFLDVPIDVSNVFFILTANNSEDIPEPLLDRLELVSINGYTKEEKAKIAQDYVIPKLLATMRSDAHVPAFPTELIKRVVSDYCFSQGVRDVEEVIERMVFGYESELLTGKRTSTETFKADDVMRYVGAPAILPERCVEMDGQVGCTKGLGAFPLCDKGCVIDIEAVKTPGTAALMLTGRIDDYMKDSAVIAFNYMRNRMSGAKNAQGGFGCHVNFPSECQIQGPSAGLAIACAIYSCSAGIPARKGIVMTGAISLTGLVLRVGCIKQKIQAAIDAGMRTVILPERNRQDVLSIWKDGKPDIRIVYVSNVTQAIEKLFGTNKETSR